MFDSKSENRDRAVEAVKSVSEARAFYCCLFLGLGLALGLGLGSGSGAILDRSRFISTHGIITVSAYHSNVPTCIRVSCFASSVVTVSPKSPSRTTD